MAYATFLKVQHNAVRLSFHISIRKNRFLPSKDAASDVPILPFGAL